MSKNIFSGGPTLGRGVAGFWDDYEFKNPFASDTPDPSLTATPSGGGSSYAKTTAGALPKQYSGAPCPDGMYTDPLNADFCILSPTNLDKSKSCPAGSYFNPVTMACEKNTELGPGGANPFTNPCPTGQTTYNGACVPYKICPAGQNYALDTKKCESSYTTGKRGAPVPPKVPVTPQPAPPVEAGMDLIPLLGIGLLLAAGVGLVIHKRNKAKGMAKNPYDLDSEED